MTDRLPLLFVSQCLPYPPHSGVTNRTYNIVTQLQREFDVRLIAFSRSAHQPDAAARRASSAALREVLTEVYEPVPIPSQLSRPRRIWDHARSSLTGRPYVYYEYESEAIEAEIRASMAAHRPAVVHFDSLDLYRYLPLVEGVPAACTHHSIESELLRLRADRIGGPLLASYLNYQARLVERVERERTPAYALNVMMSGIDAERLSRLAPGISTYVAPNGVDTESMRADGTVLVPGRVTFLGPTYMFPNRDAVEFFLAEVWPTIHETRTDASFRVVGRVAPELAERYQRIDGVKCEGFVRDLRPHLGAAECCVVPIRVGGGTRLKILDAWSLGKAVVSTSVGCEGLDAVDGQNILIRDTAGAFADAVLQVLGDADLRRRLEQEGRRTAETRYDWNAIGEGLRAAYRRLTIWPQR